MLINNKLNLFFEICKSNFYFSRAKALKLSSLKTS